MTRALNRIDQYTADTLRCMVAYVSDDSRIARHLKIDEKHVRLARLRRRKVGAA